MPYCTACGRQNPDDARFCSQCGKRIVTDGSGSGGGTGTSSMSFGDVTGGDAGESLSPADAAAIEALPAGHAMLVVQRGPGAGNRFLLDKDLVRAGRHPESDIFLDDVTVSRFHAEFSRGAEGFTVRDEGSLNGTYVNRDRVEQVVVSDGDEVQIGKYRLVFFSGAVGR